MWKNLIITFHYVRNNSKYHALSRHDLAVLLDWLLRRYRIVTLYDLREALLSHLDRATRLCCLTFDDGLQDHYVHVVPELEKRKVRAHFYVSVLPYVEEQATDIHLIQALQYRLGEERFAAELQSRYKSSGIKIDIYGDPLGPKYSKWASPLLSNAKYSLRILDLARRSKILKNMFVTFLGDLKEFTKSLYLSLEQIKEMEKKAMLFGNHGYRHGFLGDMSSWEQERDLLAADQFLREILAHAPDTISYPFGDYNEATIEICRAMGFQAGLTVHRGDNSTGTPCLELRRMDVREVLEYAKKQTPDRR